MAQFTSISVVPAYGIHTAVVRWTVDADLVGAVFHVYRSPDGVTGWTLLNDEATSELFLTDTALTSKNLVDVVHYRLLALKDALEVESPIIGIYNTLTRHEYAMCSKIQKMEFMQLSRGDGIELLVYKPLQSGVLSTQVDPDTLQHTSEPCPALPHDENSYDQLYEGGYGRPILTIARFTDTGPTIVLDRAEGLAARDENTVNARFLGFPHIAPGDMIVNHAVDDRYAVTDTVKPYKFKGIVPVAFDAKLQLLPRTDVRYRVPIPAAVPKLAPQRT